MPHGEANELAMDHRLNRVRAAALDIMVAKLGAAPGRPVFLLAFKSNLGEEP
jgi:hypothetical protein